ncbi:N-acetylmuramoyl-L-alanine amidase [Streptomyces griseorubiginosus]|uniref:peptidoglycan recognition protein family protein n=1 Tax=Streptomyces griseorubiginosus TaxID=67304 RepID=UPI002E801A42|nr:N-acetylmuramoyl-L-alanine amidase [Streptomyces griseorubiginosus]WUB46330.1 N-acetylmuramoyl-L-alanine amidase [Streptomyces griseorubiginosus]WUB54851.1 N-acetylmuramoyl-L-alanine amidase [Streptomyces griseorubiginosus]
MATPLSAAKMLAALKAEGLTVHEHAGWKTHNRDAESGKKFGPVVGVLIHHTGGHGDKELCFNGRSDLPGPLCHAWLGKTAGLWMIGNGRTNHAGYADIDVLNALRDEKPLPHDDSAKADGNDCLYGLEIENLGKGNDPYPQAQYRQAVLWAAAICRAHGWSEKSVAGHKECQPGKIDPSFDMDDFRADVKKQLAAGAGKPQPSKPAGKPRVDLSRLVTAAKSDPGAKQGHVSYMAGTNLTEAALVELGYLSRTYAGDGSFGTTTVAAYAKWQKHLGYTGADANGIPGKTSLSKLGEKTGLFTVVA